MNFWHIYTVFGLCVYTMVHGNNNNDVNNVHVTIENKRNTTITVNYQRRNPGFQGAHVITPKEKKVGMGHTIRIIAALRNRQKSTSITVSAPDEETSKTIPISLETGTCIIGEDFFRDPRFC